MESIFKKYKFDVICHFGAQAGVRHSISNPFLYEKSNSLGTLNIFELARQHGVPKVVYASSSSVYGNNKKSPFSVKDSVDLPISLYAATKRYNELLAHAYHHLYGIKMIGLRFFTVYGPWGRPDMAYCKFTKAIFEGKSIDVYNNGVMRRDFTYISDIVCGVLLAIDKDFGFEIFNLGNSEPVQLNYFIGFLEKEIGKKAKKNLLSLQPGDVKETFADIDESRKKLGFNPSVKIEKGLKEFVAWYKNYHRLK
jgi:UDP-glucuronate 4-epimerase